jgi:pyruvate,orthophosphate dikinase
MKIAVEKGRTTKPDLKLGICGEHGGDPDSVKFCHRLGLNYVSCSPYRVPIARLAAAQAALEEAAASQKDVRVSAGTKPAVTARSGGKATASKKTATKNTKTRNKPMAKKAAKKAAKKPAKKAAKKAKKK